jgi:hypothetical protein
VEAKVSDTPLDRGIRYLKERFSAADAWQASASGSRDAMTPEGIRLAPALSFLRTLA